MKYLHLFYMPQMCIFTILQQASCFFMLCLKLHAFIKENRELGLKTFVFTTFHYNMFWKMLQLKHKLSISLIEKKFNALKQSIPFYKDPNLGIINIARKTCENLMVFQFFHILVNLNS